MSASDLFNRRDMGRGGQKNDRDRSPINSGNGAEKKNNCRVFISNFPYELNWRDLKDLLRKEVGGVDHVQLFCDESGKSKGNAIVEFDTPELAKKAIDKLHRYEVDGRKIVVKDDFGAPRDKYGNLLKSNRDRSDDRPSRDNRDNRRDLPGPRGNDWGDTYGLSPGFLENLGIQPPLNYRVFVANLDYKVNEKKLREVFSLAGKVRHVELQLDLDGKSRGMAVIEYDHPVESVQAISMLNNQMLYDRRLMVRMDRDAEKDRLPEGLQSVGMGLGQNGTTLKDVARNLPSSTNNAAASFAMQPQNNLSSLTAAALSASPLSALSGLPALQAAAALAPAGGNLLTSGLDLLASRAAVADPLNFNNLAAFNAAPVPAARPETFSANIPPPSRNSAPPSKTSDTIIIDNLPSDYSWQELKDKFRDAGEIKFAEMRGKIGLVRFASEWEALRAVSLLDRTRVDGELIDVRLF